MSERIVSVSSQKWSVCVAATLACLALAGCKRTSDEEKRNATKVTPESTDDATAPIVDEDYRFKLDWPGRGWKLLREREASKVNLDAIAALLSSRGAWALVIVERSLGLGLEETARYMVDAMPIQDKDIHEIAPAEFAGREGYKFSVSGSLKGVPHRYFGRLTLRGEHVYRMVAWTTELGDAGESEFEPAFRAFSLLEGEVVERTKAVAVKESAGPGWRYQGGRFESAVTGIRVRPESSSRIIIGGELMRMNADAEVGLSSRDPETLLVLIPEHKAGAELSVYRQARLADAGMVPAGEPWKARLGASGPEVEFGRYSLPSEPLAYHVAVIETERFFVQILGWHVHSLGEQGRAAVERAVGMVELMREGDARALAEQLRATEDTSSAVGVGYSYRGGVFRDFEHKLTWRRPDGLWRVHVGDRAKAFNPAARLVINDPMSGTYGLLIAEGGVGTTNQALHAAMARDFGITGSPRPFAMAGGTGLVSEGVTTNSDISLKKRIITSVLGGTAIQFALWGNAGLADEVEQAMTKAAGQLGFEPELVAEQRTGGRYVDHRFGFAFETPSPEVVLSDATPPQMTALGKILTWESRPRGVTLIAINALDEEQDEEFFAGLLEQIARERLGSMTGAAPTRGWSTLAGLRARHLRWAGSGRIDALFVLHRRTFYAILVIDKKSGKLADRTRDGFTLIP